MSGLRIAAAVGLAAAAMSTGTATASDLLVTPAVGVVRLSGGACVFVGSATIGNPLTSRTLLTTDPRTGVYTRCPY